MNRYRFEELEFHIGDYLVNNVEMTGEESECILEIEKGEHTIFYARYNFERGLFLDNHQVIHEVTPKEQVRFLHFISQLSKLLLDDTESVVSVSHMHSCRCGLTKTCDEEHIGTQVIQVSCWDTETPEFLGDEFVCSACAAKAKTDKFINQIKELAKPTLSIREKWRTNYPDKPQATAVSFTESELGRQVAELIEEMEKST